MPGTRLSLSQTNLKQRNKVETIFYLIVHLVQVVRVSSSIFGNKDSMLLGIIILEVINRIRTSSFSFIFAIESIEKCKMGLKKRNKRKSYNLHPCHKF